ncbi:MAG: GIY-YIG nuclease family protein [Ignavibacteria bacterium]|nr:GIY-YIG nuclease family protein [Ignavibacteria bacterium]
MPCEYFVYILTNRSNRVLYTGMTNDLKRRMFEHKTHVGSKFTSTYNVTKLVYFETFDNPSDAIAREKQIKAGSRQKKIELIENMNPSWNDLTDAL